MDKESLYEHQCKVVFLKNWDIFNIGKLPIMLLLLIFQMWCAHHFFKRARHKKAKLAKFIILFNIVGAASMLLFFTFQTFGALYEIDKLYYIGAIGTGLLNFANYLNYWYLIRMKRV